VPGGEPGSTDWLFIKVPEGKTAKNRLHIDFGTADREAEVARLLTFGAQRIGDHDEWGAVWTTLADVEGNEFCVVQRA
jgi:predicted enzyme related to lactoylglutathione lyase